MTLIEDPATEPQRLTDDQDVHMRPRPFHTHPFLIEGGKAGHAHAGSHEPHSHQHEVNPYAGNRYQTMEEYLPFVRRVIAGLATRVGDADVDALAEMVKLRADLDGAISAAVAGLRHDEAAPASWAELGEALGITRQAAQKRYGEVGGIRTAGGQRSEWR